MKKAIIIFLAVILLLLPTACKSNNKTDSETSTSSGQETAFKNTVSSSDILDLFGKAESAYSWFTSFSNISTGDNTVEINGETFKNVVNNDFCSSDTLKQYLLTLFDDKTTGQLMDRKTDNGNPYFVDTDYDLYAFVDTFGIYQYEINDKNYVVKQTAEDEIILTVVIKYTSSDGTFSCTNNYTVKYINEKWVFTDFKLPYEVILENAE